MSNLFETTSVAGIKLRNRFVRSATWEGLADEDGLVSDCLIEMMTELAVGEVGLIISGHTYISPDGQAGKRQLAVDRDECIPGLTRLAAKRSTRAGWPCRPCRVGALRDIGW